MKASKSSHFQEISSLGAWIDSWNRIPHIPSVSLIIHGVNYHRLRLGFQRLFSTADLSFQHGTILLDGWNSFQELQSSTCELFSQGFPPGLSRQQIPSAVETQLLTWGSQSIPSPIKSTWGLWMRWEWLEAAECTGRKVPF